MQFCMVGTVPNLPPKFTIMTDQLIIISTYLVAVSLATERLVALIKSLAPWLAKERTDQEGLINLADEKWRNFSVQVLSFLAAWVTTSLLNNSLTDPLADVCLSQESKLCWPTVVIALLSTGGSAFWSNVLGYANAVKDIKKQQRTDLRMNLIQRSKNEKTELNRVSSN
jgi:hypothetical protein